MKMSQSIISLAVLAVLTAACGKHEKNPIPELTALKNENKANGEVLGPEKPKEITKTVIVEKQIEVKTQSNVVDNSYLSIVADSDINFTEGKASSFNIIGRSQVPGATVTLKAQNLPEGAKFELKPTATEKFNYVLSWTPSYNTVATGSGSKSFKVKITAELGQVQGKEQKTAQVISNEKQVVLFVVPSQSAPTDLQVSGLNASVSEGAETPFQVTVVVPGVDDKSAQKPKLIPSYDGVSMTPGNSFLELDGTRHIVPDLSKNHTEYLGNFKWRYNLIFDTKNISVQPPMAANKTVLNSAPSSRVRLSFMVIGARGAESANVLKQIEILLDKPVEAPRFDFSGLNGASLALTPGKKTTLIFTASSSNAAGTVKVETPNISTLVGAPSLSCKAVSTAKQECTLTWDVPASATEADLTQELSLTASSTYGGRNSEPVKHVLKISMAKPKEGGK